MEELFINMIQFVVYFSTLIPAVLLMVNTSGAALRRMEFAIAVLFIICNERIAIFLYMVIVAVMEIILAILGLAFCFFTALILCMLPIFLIIKWLLSKL